MTRQGVAPKHFLTTTPPLYKACLYGKMTRRPWHVKGQTTNASNIRQADQAGDIVLVDQLESPLPGLIAQLKGRLTNQRYTTATVFVDHKSSFGFIYLQWSTSAKETIEAKVAFECFAATHGVQIKQYHADNGRFADNALLIMLKSRIKLSAIVELEHIIRTA